MVHAAVGDVRHRRGGHRRAGRERGAAAVEMALVLPVLLFVLMGLIDFGRAYNAQMQLTQAAREGARLVSLGMPIGSRVQQAAPELTGTATPTVTVLASCPAGSTGDAKVQVRSTFTWITGITALSHLFGGTFVGPNTLSSTGVMQCNT